MKDKSNENQKQLSIIKDQLVGKGKEIADIAIKKDGWPKILRQAICG